jgi:hypothetical protein
MSATARLVLWLELLRAGPSPPCVASAPWFCQPYLGAGVPRPCRAARCVRRYIGAPECCCSVTSRPCARSGALCSPVQGAPATSSTGQRSMSRNGSLTISGDQVPTQHQDHRKASVAHGNTHGGCRIPARTVSIWLSDRPPGKRSAGGRINCEILGQGELFHPIEDEGLANSESQTARVAQHGIPRDEFHNGEMVLLLISRSR